MKIDAHTHTHYCPHSSGEHVEKMIQKAIELEFDEYHITEHPPLPDSFLKKLYPLEVIPTITMSEQETDDYIKEMLNLKNRYKDNIKIKVGFEIDYLPEHTIWTKNFLNEYGKYCDTGLLSIHYLKGNNGWRCVDFNEEDMKEGLVSYYGDTEKFQLAYYNLVKESIETDLGKYKPNRIGHLTLCNKFKNYIEMEKSNLVDEKILEILQLIKKQNCVLDFNTAGLYKPYCGEAYPPDDILRIAQKMEIPFMYGSDAHGVGEVGRGYDFYKARFE